MQICINKLQVTGSYGDILDFDSRFKRVYTDDVTITKDVDYIDDDIISSIIDNTIINYEECTGSTVEYLSHTVVETNNGLYLIEIKASVTSFVYSFESFIPKPSTVLQDPKKWMLYNWSSLSDCTVVATSSELANTENQHYLADLIYKGYEDIVDIEDIVTNSYKFTTEQNYPRNVIATMAELFPTLSFTLYYGNYEGCYAGIFSMKNEEYLEDEYYDDILYTRSIFSEHLDKNLLYSCPHCGCKLGEDDKHTEETLMHGTILNIECPYCSNVSEFDLLPF